MLTHLRDRQEEVVTRNAQSNQKAQLDMRRRKEPPFRPRIRDPKGRGMQRVREGSNARIAACVAHKGICFSVMETEQASRPDPGTTSDHTVASSDRLLLRPTTAEPEA